MKEIKKYIIHLLGGYTKEGFEDGCFNSFNRGMLNFAKGTKFYLESLDGKPADEWCKLAYEWVCKMAIETKTWSKWNDRQPEDGVKFLTIFHKKGSGYGGFDFIGDKKQFFAILKLREEIDFNDLYWIELPE